MSELNEKELIALIRLVAGEGEITVTWDKPQGFAIFQTINNWLESHLPSLYEAMNDAAPGVTDDGAKKRFVKAYMQVKSLGVPERRSPTGYYDDVFNVHRELEAQTDRAVAIVGAAFLDAKLEMVLNLHCAPALSNNEQKNLFRGPTAPLGSFSGKMRVAHAFGLIGPRSYADLKLIAKIRNRFAHDLQITNFSEPAIIESCSKLQLADYVFSSQEIPHDPRGRFLNSVVNIMHFMYSEIVAGTEIGEVPRVSP